MIEVKSLTTQFGTARINNNGYWQITSGKEGNHLKYLHRLIYETFHKCTLFKDATVHHKDGDKLNNRINNLELMSKSEHKKLHNQTAIVSDETRRKRSEAMKGRHLSEEHKQKIRNANKGKIFSEEHRKKISEANKGKKIGLEHKLYLSERKNTTGYYNVVKKRDKKSKQGFYWAYQYYEDGKRKVLSSNDLDKLRYRVISRGLKWVKFDKGD